MPVALVGLAVVMPVEGLTPASAAEAWADRAACQADSLGAQVTQAARALCGSGSGVAILPPATPLPDAAAPSIVLVPPVSAAPLPGIHLDPHRIDLPPPC